MDVEMVFKAVEDKADLMAKMLSGLIRIDTTIPPGKMYDTDFAFPSLNQCVLSVPFHVPAPPTQYFEAIEF